MEADCAMIQNITAFPYGVVSVSFRTWFDIMQETIPCKYFDGGLDYENIIS